MSDKLRSMTVKILMAGSRHAENSVLKKTAETLRTESSAEIFWATDGDELGRLCQEHDFALCILDETRPAISERIDIHPLSPLTTLLSIVSSELDIPRSKSVQKGGYLEYLCQPFLPSLLLGKIHSLLHIHQLKQELLSCKELLREQSEKNHQWQQSLEQQSHYLNMLSIRDGLTGLFNRRHLGHVLEQEMERARTQNRDLALFLLDIDYFNETNRMSGQIFGDSILNEFAARLTQNSRDSDLCFRFGGSDFIVLLPEMERTEAMEHGEKLRLACFEKPFTSGRHSRSVTVSIGIVNLLANDPKTPDDFITMADKALYQAKSEGRNRVVAYEQKNDLKDGKIDTISLLQGTLRRILEKSKKSSLASIQSLAQNISGKDKDEHIDLATQYIHLLCERLELPKTILEKFTNALTLYSCFRLLLHRELLSKKEKFSPDDRKLFNDLPHKLVELTQHFDYFANEREMLLSQGEHYDGSGHPEGLAGEEISLAARIFSLANALAAMSSDRPHRKHLSPPQILKELLRGAGTQWDPSLVLLAFDILGEQQRLPLDEEGLLQARRQVLEKITPSSGSSPSFPSP